MKLTAEVIRSNRYIAEVPTWPQLRFLSLPHKEAFYGGALGGGKSSALLMAALMFVDEPGYSAILFRKTFSELALDGALMDRAREWLAPTDARYNERDKRWSFPSGAALSFGYLDGPNDFARYQSSEYDFIGADEATELRPRDYLRVLTRLRRRVDSRIPLRARAAGNPGGIAHEFFGERFVHPKEPQPDKVFIPALLEDNPYLDTDEYEATLANLSEIEYAQLRRGQWVRDESGHPFKRSQVSRYDPSEHREVAGRWISWDTALKDTEGSAYNAAVVVELMRDYTLRVRHVWRERATFPDLVPQIESMAAYWNFDGKLRGCVVEEKASGISALQTLRVSSPAWLQPLLAAFNPGSKSKLERYSQAALWVRRGMVALPEPSEAVPWLYEAEAELYAVPDSQYADIADSLSQAVIYLEALLADGYALRGAA